MCLVVYIYNYMYIYIAHTDINIESPASITVQDLNRFLCKPQTESS